MGDQLPEHWGTCPHAGSLACMCFLMRGSSLLCYHIDLPSADAVLRMHAAQPSLPPALPQLAYTNDLQTADAVSCHSIYKGVHEDEAVGELFAVRALGDEWPMLVWHSRFGWQCQHKLHTRSKTSCVHTDIASAMMGQFPLVEHDAHSTSGSGHEIAAQSGAEPYAPDLWPSDSHKLIPYAGSPDFETYRQSLATRPEEGLPKEVRPQVNLCILQDRLLRCTFGRYPSTVSVQSIHVHVGTAVQVVVAVGRRKRTFSFTRT